MASFFALTLLLINIVNNGFIFFLISIAIDFLAGFLVSIELNHVQHSHANYRKPSWGTFILWIFIASLFGAIPLILGILVFHNIVTFFAQEIIIVIGIGIGIRRGNIADLLIKPESIYRVVCERDENGAYYFKIRSPLDWSKFFRGFVIGLTIYGLITFAGPLPFSLQAIYYTFASGLLASIPIGFMLGSIYGFGPATYAWVKSRCLRGSCVKERQEESICKADTTGIDSSCGRADFFDSNSNKEGTMPVSTRLAIWL